MARSRSACPAGLPQTPRGGALHPVIVAASAGNIAGTGETALVVGDRVIEVAARHWPAADREPAVLITNLNEVPHPVRHPVSVSRVGVSARGNPIVVYELTVVGGRIRTADLADSRRASLQHGLQSGYHPRRRGRSPGRIQPTQRGGGWLIQEGDRHSDGDPPEHTGPRRTAPGAAGPGAPRSGGAGLGAVGGQPRSHPAVPGGGVSAPVHQQPTRGDDLSSRVPGLASASGSPRSPGRGHRSRRPATRRPGRTPRPGLVPAPLPP